MSIKYVAFSKKQLQLLTWWTEESPYHDANGVIAEGAIRAGKTVIMGLSFVLWSMQKTNEVNYAICGKTVASTRRNIIEPLVEMLRKRKFKVIDRKTDGKLVIIKDGKVNSYYIFGGKDEGSAALIQGITLGGVLFDEVALMPRSFVEQAIARCSIDGSKYWFNCNPESPQHWFYLEHIKKSNERRYLRIHFCLEDNPSLSQERIDNYKSLYTGIFYKRFILGEWSFANGIIYDMVTDDNFYNNSDKEKEVPIKILENDIKPFYGVDFGTANPQVYLEVYKYIDYSKKKLCFYVENEYYWDSRKMLKQKTTEEYVSDFNGWCKEFVCLFVDPSATPLKAAHRKYGHNVVNAKNDVAEGIIGLSTLFANNMIKINKDNCPNLCMELGSYRWNEKKLDNGKEEVLKENDHCCDALRYAIMTSTPLSIINAFVGGVS